MLSQITITRTADTTSYSGWDYINNAGSSDLIWLPVSYNDKIKKVLLKSCFLKLNTSVIPTGMTYLKMFFYGSKVAGNFADNASQIAMSTYHRDYRMNCDTGTVVATSGCVSAPKTSYELMMEVADENPANDNRPGLWFAVQTGAAITTPPSGLKFTFDFGFIGVE